MPADAVAVLHAGRQGARGGSSANSRSSSAGRVGGGLRASSSVGVVLPAAAVPTSIAAAAAASGGGAAAEILQELRALREAMSAGAGAFSSRVASRTASRSTSRVTSRVASRAASLEPPRGVGGIGGSIGGGIGGGIGGCSGGSAFAAARPNRSVSPTIPAPGTLEGLSRELRRTTDAYFALVRLTTAERAAAAERESALLNDLTRARAAAEAAASRTARRERERSRDRDTGYDVSAQQLSGAAAAAASVTASTSTSTSTAAAAATHAFLPVTAPEPSTSAPSTDEVYFTRRSLAAAEDRVSTLSSERDVLIDFVQVRKIKLYSESVAERLKAFALSLPNERCAPRCAPPSPPGTAIKTLRISQRNSRRLVTEPSTGCVRSRLTRIWSSHHGS